MENRQEKMNKIIENGKIVLKISIPLSHAERYEAWLTDCNNSFCGSRWTKMFADHIHANDKNDLSLYLVERLNKLESELLKIKGVENNGSSN